MLPPSTTRNGGGHTAPVVISSHQSSTQEDPGTQLGNPTTSSAGAVVGENSASLANGAGASIAPAPTLSSEPAQNGNGAPPATSERQTANPTKQGGDSGAPASRAPASNTASVIGGHTISRDPSHSGGVVVGSQSLQAGAQTTLDSTPLSIGQQGSVAIGTSSTVNVASAPQVVGGQSISTDPSNSGGVVVAGQTLQPGAQTTISNMPVSVGEGGTVAVGGSTTVNVASVTQVLGGHTIAADPSGPGGIVIAGHTLQPGGQTTIDQTPVSVDQSGTVAFGSDTVNAAPAAANSAPAVATIGSLSLSADPSIPGAIVFGASQTLTSGQMTTIGNTPVSVGSGGVVVAEGPRASSTFALQSAQSLVPVVIATISGQAVTATSGPPVAIDGSTLIAGGPVATIGGQAVSLGSQGLVVGSSTAAYSTESPVDPQAAAVTIGGSTYTAFSGSPLVIGSNTLSEGGPDATISGQLVSLGPQGIAVGSNSVAYSATPTGGVGAVVSIGGNLYTAYSAAPLAIGSTTLSAGGPAGTVDGQRISVGSNGVVVGSSTEAYFAAAAPTETDGAIVTLGGNVYSASSGAPLIIGSTTLSAGGPAALIDGQKISMGPQGIVVGSTTASYSVSGPQSELPNLAVTLGLQVYTASESSGNVVVGSITLTPGGPAQTISGEVLSAAPSGSGVVIDEETMSFSKSPIIINGLTAASEAAFTISGHPYTAFEVAGHSREIIIPGIASGSSITLGVGGPPATILGQVVSAGSDGLVFGSRTIPYVSATPTSDPLEVEAPFTLGRNTYTAFEVASHSGELIIPGASVTLSIGGPATTISGETLSAASGGLVINGSADAFATVTAATLPIVQGATDGSSTTGAPSSASPTSSFPNASTMSSSDAPKSVLEWHLIVIAAVFSAGIICLLP